MATTTNFGWTTPDNTGYVKDGALAIRTLGNSIDTSLVDLKGGTTGQLLAKASATDLDFSWVSSGGMTLISTTTLTGTTVTLNGFSGYNDLQLILIGAYGSNQVTFHARFNGDSGNNYYVGSTLVGLGESVRNKAALGDGLSSSSTNVDLRNYSVLKMQRYAGAAGKPYQIESGYIYWNNTAINYINAESGIYASSTAVTSIDLYLSSGNFSGGTAYLYGVK